MTKNILILNGSTRHNGNTSRLVEEFTKGAEKAGHEVTTFNIQQMNIHPCLGCLGGGKDPDSPCHADAALHHANGCRRRY